MDKAPNIFTLQEICEMLIKHAGITEGGTGPQSWNFRWALPLLQLMVVCPFPPILVGVSRIGLQSVAADHPQAVNAGTAANAAKRPRTAKKAAKVT